MKKTFLMISLLLSISIFCLTGCSNETTQELAIYQASMETFCDNITYLNGEINKLDGSGENDIHELLSHLDTLNDQFAQLAELSVPEQFENVADLASEASENMNMAVEYYHQAYEGEKFNQNYADAAFEYYSRANLRLNYILRILHGETITDENVVYTTETEETSEDTSFEQ